MSESVAILVNGQPRLFPPGVTLLEVLAVLGVTQDSRGVAVAVRGEVISRSKWSSHVLDEGAVIDVVGAVQGG